MPSSVGAVTDTIRWAIAGPGAIAGDFARALPHARLGVLHAIAGRDAGRAEAFAAEHGASIIGTHAEIFARDDVDAVYIAAVHTAHLDLAVAALEAGKAVLCEKPLTATTDDTERLLAAAERTGMPLVEAFKYRFGPLPARIRELIAGGAIGEVVELEATCGFAAGERTGRLFDPATAGGAILDVGCYPVSLAVGVAAWSRQLRDTAVLAADGVIGPTGVDESATATLRLGGITAYVRTSIVEDLPDHARIVGTAGILELPDPWGSRTVSASSVTLHGADGAVEEITADVVSPMAVEGDAVALALREGRTQAPEMPWAETLEIAQLLDAWRAALPASRS